MADTRFKKGQVPWNKKQHIEKKCKCGKIFHVKQSLDRIVSCSRSCGQSGKTTSSKQKHAAHKTAITFLPKFSKGHKPWNKGLKGFLSGENHYNWKGGGTKLERQKFRDQMQKTIFERDDYTCQMCLVRGGTLQVDHIQSWADYADLRFEISNCRTLCMACHYKITFNKPMPSEKIAWGHNFKYVGVRRAS